MSFYVKIDFRVEPENDIKKCRQYTENDKKNAGSIPKMTKKMPAVYKTSAGIIITI